MIGTTPPCVLNLIHEVGNKQQSNYPGLVRQSQKLDAVIDVNFTDNTNLTSIFSKVIGEKSSNGSIWYLYTRCRMNLAEDPVHTQTPQFIDLGLSKTNTLDEERGISTPDTRIRRTTDVSHCSAPNHIFGETTVVGVSESKSDYDYKYKTEFQI